MKQALVILAQNGYQDTEYEHTRMGLEDGGFSVTVASEHCGLCHGKMGGQQEASIELRRVQVTDYDLVAFIGGPGAFAYASHPEALRIANDAYREQMPLGAICIAPTILAKAQVLDGKRATVWDGDGNQSGVLETYGATYTGEQVTVDGQIVTANGPEAALEFGSTLAAIGQDR